VARLRIGLTGGIASGKSTAAERFSELGIPVIDADEVARAVVLPGSPGLARVIERFGAGVAADGGLDRRALRQVIFSDPAARKNLEAILHPLIHAEIERRATDAIGPYVVIATPLLVEGGKLDRFDRILVVDIDEDIQLARVMARDACSLEQARAILDAQATRAERLKAAHDVLVNTGTVSELRQAVDDLHQRYLRLAENNHSAKTDIT
jgi:dephospho-CoA kinase